MGGQGGASSGAGEERERHGGCGPDATPQAEGRVGTGSTIGEAAPDPVRALPIARPPWPTRWEPVRRRTKLHGSHLPGPWGIGQLLAGNIQQVVRDNLGPIQTRVGPGAIQGKQGVQRWPQLALAKLIRGDKSRVSP